MRRLGEKLPLESDLAPVPSSALGLCDHVFSLDLRAIPFISCRDALRSRARCDGAWLHQCVWSLNVLESELNRAKESGSVMWVEMRKEEPQGVSSLQCSQSTGLTRRPWGHATLFCPPHGTQYRLATKSRSLHVTSFTRTLWTKNKGQECIGVDM